MLLKRDRGSSARSCAIPANRLRLFLLIVGTLIALLALLLLSPSRASAIDFDWLIVDASGDALNNVEGTVTVPEGVGVAALSVEITNAGGLSFTVPEETTDGTLIVSSWNVTANAIEAVLFSFVGFADPPVFGESIFFFQVGQGFVGALSDGVNSRSGDLFFNPPSQPPAVPEPASFVLLATGLVVLGILRTKKAFRT